jgi:hypothetical protein
MPNRSIQCGTEGRRGDHKPNGLHRQPRPEIRPCEVPPPRPLGTIRIPNDDGRRAWGVSSPVEQAILQIVRSRGGRLLLAELVFEMRWRGMRPEPIEASVKKLVRSGLLRGPLAQSATYELTVVGWDVSAVAIGRS